MRPFTVLPRELPRSGSGMPASAVLTATSAGSFLRRAKGGRARVRRALWAGGLAALLCGCAGNKPPPPSTDIEENGFRDALRILASDDFEGRKPGTRGEERTVAFLVAQLRKLGLKPGNGESYLQQVPLVEITAAEDASLRLSGHGGAHSLRYGKDMVIWTKRVVPTAQLKASELVFAGYGTVAPEYGWDDYAQLDVHGKTVLVLVGDPGYGAKDQALFRGNTATHYATPGYKLEEAARHGAAGVLLIHDKAVLGYGWSAVANRSSGAQFELPAADEHAARAAVEGWVTLEAAQAMFVQAALDYRALAGAAARRGFKAVSLGLEVDAELHNTIRRVSSANVAAILPGSDRKKEYVLYTAHWDGLGRDGAGVSYGGAIEDASGVAGLLMLAQSFSRTRPTPDRSIVFIAFTGTESDLVGSRYYVDNPLFSLRQTAGVLNLDGLHLGGRTRDVVIYGAGNSEMEDSVRAAALLQGREVRDEAHPERGMYFRSDELSFARHGVPALFFGAGIDDSAHGPKWGEAALDDYLSNRYLQTGDKYTEDADVYGALDDLTLYYVVGNRLAQSRRFPRWYPASEFSAGHREAATD